MTGALARATVVVTRPREQAAELVQALEALGAEVVLAPGITIESAADEGVAQRARDLLPAADWLVFISRNAVRHGTALLRRTGVVVPRGTGIAAVGPGTAAELQDWGWTVTAAPATGGGGDALLATQAFGVGAGERVVIVRGVGGRERLAEGLRGRDASVAYLEVYRRCPAPAPVEALRSGWQSPERRVTIVTSDSAVRALVDGLPPGVQGQLLGSRPVIISERLGRTVRELGFTRRPVVADGAATSELVAAAERAAAETEEMP